MKYQPSRIPHSAALLLAVAFPASADIVISQYYEGSSFNKYLELHNTGASPVTLTDYTLTYWNNANTEAWKTAGGTPSASMDLSEVTLAPGDYYLLSHASAASPAYAFDSVNLKDSSVINFNGDDSMVLYSSATIDPANIVDALSFTDAGNEGKDNSIYRLTDDAGSGVSFDTTAGTTVLDYPAVWGVKTNAEVDAALGTDLFYLQAQVSGESLTLAIVPSSFLENAGDGAATATVTRSGSTTGDLEVTITISDPSEATGPETVTILDGNDSVEFSIDAVDDTAGDGDQTVAVKVEASGYASASEDLTVQDDGDAFVPSAIVINQYYEGPSFDKYLELKNISGAPATLDGYSLTVWTNASSENWKTATGGPSNSISLDGITIPTDGYFLIKDPRAENPPYAASGADTSTYSVSFNGNDSVVLYYNGTPDARGDIADALSLPNSPSVGKDTSFYRLSDAQGYDLTLGSTPLDYPEVWAQSTLDEVANATDTDAFYLSNGSPFGPLVIELADSIVSEGAGATATTGTVTRSNTDGELVVTLTSSDETAATVPASVVIADGATTSASFEIAAVDDEEIDGNQTTIIAGDADLYQEGSASLVVTDDEATPLIVNEILADPATSIDGDANGDGVSEFTDDEFVELVNNTDAVLDISYWAILEDGIPLHFFSEGSILQVGQAIVVFGGGTPTGSFGGALVQTASEDVDGYGLSLNNGGDTLQIADTSQEIVGIITYGSDAGNDQSISLNPDLTGVFAEHSTIPNAEGALFSPGTRTNGASFTGGTEGGYSDWETVNNVTEGPDGDDDKDGIDNLAEYGLGLDPQMPDPTPGSFSAGALSFDKGAEAVANDDVTWSIETSPNLQDPWETVESVQDSSTISYTLPDGLGKIFARLRVTQK